MDCKQLFAGKRITLMGLGLLGRGVGDAAFLAECGAHVLVTDKKTETELAESVAKLKQYSNIAFRLGGHDIKDFQDCDMVLKAAGVPLDSPEIVAARAANIPVVMSTALFAKYAMEMGATVIGITGTRGKTTTTQMIYEILKAAGKKVLLGGNVRGVSTLAMLPMVEKDMIVVLELDSWQLQGFGDLKISPHIAVFTNLMHDHLNYYGNEGEYFNDKANIFKFQKDGDILINNPDLADRIRPLSPLADVFRLEPHYPVPQDWCPHLAGEHNLYNAAFAVAALEKLGLSEREIRGGLESFEPVEGRLQLVREVGGVKIYNDNNATTPEATVAALKALRKNITLIAGGSEKELSIEELVSEIKNNVSHVILLTHPNYKGSVRLAEALRKADVPFEEVSELSAALRSAVEKTKTGTILFSPAFASFGMFNNEYDRNDTFVALVKNL